MASGNAAGELRIYVEKAKTGDFVKVLVARSDSAIAAGFSPDGVLANLTIDKQTIYPRNTRTVAVGGDVVHLLIKLDAADGLDASDSTIQVAFTEPTGLEGTLNASDFGYTTDLPAATVADQWVELGTGYTVPNNVSFQIGAAGTSTVIAIENDT